MSDRAARRLHQVTQWDPLDLTDPGLPPVVGVGDLDADEGAGIQPDTDTRPGLRAVPRPATPRSSAAGPTSAPAPWDG